jgi:hypothetical protein
LEASRTQVPLPDAFEMSGGQARGRKDSPLAVCNRQQSNRQTLRADAIAGVALRSGLVSWVSLSGVGRHVVENAVSRWFAAC